MLTLTTSARARIRVIRARNAAASRTISAGSWGRRTAARHRAARRPGPSASWRPAPGPAPASRRAARASRVGSPPASGPDDTAGAAVPLRVEPIGGGPEASSSARASVVGRSVRCTRSSATPSASRPASRSRPNRSDDRPPVQATGMPSRPIARAALYGPPPGTAAIAPSGRTRRSTRASPATTITGSDPDRVPDGLHLEERGDPLRALRGAIVEPVEPRVATPAAGGRAA